MTEEQNKAIVRAMVDALNMADWEALEQHPGMAETRRFFPMFRSAFPDLKLEIVTEMAEGDLVALRMNAHGTHLGAFLGVAPTGKKIDFGIVSIDQLADGKIVQHNANAEWMGVFITLGVISPPSLGQ